MDVVGLEQLLGQVTPFSLVLTRMLGLFLFAPLLAGFSVPSQVKALLASAVSVAVYGSLPESARVAPAAMSAGLVPLVVVMASELAIGAVIGLLASIPLLAVETAGQIMSRQMGFGLAEAYNPTLDTNLDTFGSMLFNMGLAAFVGMGGLESLFGAVLSTYGRLPPGGFALGGAPLGVYLHVLSSGMELAMRVSAPVVGIIVLMLIGLGAVTRAMPQVNVMTVGFTMKILMGIGVLSFSVFAIDTAVGDFVAEVLGKIGAWAAGGDGAVAGG